MTSDSVLGESRPQSASDLPPLDISRLFELCNLYTTFDNNVQYYLKAGRSLKCDSDALERYPVDKNLDRFSKFGSLTSSLILIDLTQDEAERVLSHFPNLSHLTMKNVFIAKGLASFPVELEKLKLWDCKIQESFIEMWLSRLARTLTRFQVKRSHFKVSLERKGSICSMVELLPNLVEAHLEDNKSDLIIRSTSATLKRLTVIAKVCDLRCGEASKLENLLYDVPGSTAADLRHLSCDQSLKSLTLKTCPKDILELGRFTALETLKIIESMDPVMKAELQSLNLVTLDVHFYEPPLGKDRILMLPDSCLRRIVSFLPRKYSEWIALQSTHPRFRKLIKGMDSPEMYLYLSEMDTEADPKDAIETIGVIRMAHAIKGDESQSVILKFPFLRREEISLRNPHNTRGTIESIPANLQQLVLYLHNISQCHWLLKDAFFRLDPNLVYLKLHVNGVQEFNLSCLQELHHIVKFDIQVPHSLDLSPFLEQNKNTLEDLTIRRFFYGPDVDLKDAALGEEYDTFADGNSLHKPPIIATELIPLPRLKTLCLEDTFVGVPLKPRDYPQLRAVKVSVAKEIRRRKDTFNFMLQTVSELYRLRKLQLHTEGFTWNWGILSGLKHLECLEVFDHQYDETELFDLFFNLKKFREIGFLHIKSLDLALQHRLRSLAHKEGRTIKIYSISAPWIKIVINP